MSHSNVTGPSTLVATSLAELITSIHTPQFGETLLRSVHTTVGGDCCSVMKLEPGDAPECLFAGGQIPHQLKCKLVRDYVERFYQDDPTLNRICNAREVGNIIVRPFDNPDDYAKSYRKRFFRAARVTDKISAGLWLDGCLIYSSFYKLEPNNSFSDIEIDNFSYVAPVLSAAILKNGASQARERDDRGHRYWQETKIESLPFAKLTKREQTVCACIIEGCTSEAISLRLGISLNSVLCYRKRAYAKLGITSVNELFSIVLKANQHQSKTATYASAL